MRGNRNIADLCAQYGMNQSQYYHWRNQFLREGEKVFSNNQQDKREAYLKQKMAKMEQVIGKLTLELKKND